MKTFVERLTRRSLALRLALASALFGLVVVCGAMAVGYWTLSRQLDDRLASDLQGRAQLLAHLLADVPNVSAAATGNPRFSELFFGHDDLHLALAQPHGGPLIAGFSDIGVQSVAELRRAAIGAKGLSTWHAGGGRFSGIQGITALADGQQVEYFLVVDRHRDARLLADTLESTLLSLPLLLLVVGLGAGLIARTGLAPLRRFNRLAASIGARTLDQRVSMAGLPVELADLATEFNAMLARIDAGYRQLEQFAGDLAHEMRTPVANLLGRTQVALSQTRSIEQLREVLEGNVEELDRLSALISDMLFIARADHQVDSIQAETVDLVQEAQRVAEFMALGTDEKQLHLQVSGTAPTLQADRSMVQRAITNLLSNAVRHASERSTIEIEIAAVGGVATVSVTNLGDGIPPENIGRIFERFYRVDRARARGDGGTGLGLAIVRSIAAMHGGTVTARSEAGRTTFTLSFPLAEAAGVPSANLRRRPLLSQASSPTAAEAGYRAG
jgi:two-component system, OmpR family, heavy metal sensor histidine kinase CusS